MITSDLGELDQLDAVAAQILERSRGTLHGYVSGAGVGPTNRKPSRLLAVNAFGCDRADDTASVRLSNMPRTRA